MPPSWRDGLVNAFPVPRDRVKGKRRAATSAPADALATLEDGMDGLTIASPTVSTVCWFDLPAEIRNNIYRALLFSAEPRPGGADRLEDGPHRRAAILATSKRVHQEAAYILYSARTFKVFALQDFTRTPTVQELRPMYRAMVTQLELVLGSSWTSPPKAWRVSKLLARRLRALSGVHTLIVVIELDPSLPMFKQYRVSFDFYTDFCGNLLRDVLAAMPHVAAIELRGNPGVESTGPLCSRMIAEAEAQGKSCAVAPTRPAPSSHRPVRIFV